MFTLLIFNISSLPGMSFLCYFLIYWLALKGTVCFIASFISSFLCCHTILITFKICKSPLVYRALPHSLSHLILTIILKSRYYLFPVTFYYANFHIQKRWESFTENLHFPPPKSTLVWLMCFTTVCPSLLSIHQSLFSMHFKVADIRGFPACVSAESSFFELTPGLCMCAKL